MAADKPKKKTPSPKVIAAYVLRDALTKAGTRYSAEDMEQLADSRVNGAKAAKVFEQMGKAAAALLKRVEATVSRFEKPPEKNG